MKSKYLFLILIVLSFFFSCSQEDELVIYGAQNETYIED